MLQQFYPQVQHNFRYELNKDMQLAAAHYIPHPDAGICQRVHGHTYFINLTIAGDQLDEMGFLINFQRLKELVHGRWDHRLLNEDTAMFNAGGTPPSTEVVAETIWRIVEEELRKKPNRPHCVQVVVRETPTSYVVFRPKKGIDYA
ncbi:6-carboxytetrahydropterin synthase QueD [Alicyclobacillus contaminans]|uniref:6-pyruvoyl trahydropterin synthase family protein n=1 Tax=Alicyclobacillus contaminans TaxID=392016 RepID=UPI000407A094|nr:6-pyruvoyl tetrahydropterin synthase family protein [Alicyclobacillus contaminans]GMA50079.1 6-carboxytetrahydropterin synthase QueD [Alicyclobacillus contaminans]